MNRTAYLADRLKEVYINGYWIANTNIKEQLNHINFLEANEIWYGNNCIGAITFHLNYYLSGILSAVNDGELKIKDRLSFDYTPMESEEQWSKLKTELIHHAEQIIKYVSQLNVHSLDEPFFDMKYGNWLRNIDGIIEHSYYHLGQIVLLSKNIKQKLPNN